MKNKIDILFKHAVKEHSLPNSGPVWNDLEKRLQGRKRKPLLFFGLGVLALVIIPAVLFVIFKQPASTSEINTPYISAENKPAAPINESENSPSQLYQTTTGKDETSNYSSSSNGSAKVPGGHGHIVGGNVSDTKTQTNPNADLKDVVDKNQYAMNPAEEQKEIKKDVVALDKSDEKATGEAADSTAVVKANPAPLLKPNLKNKRPGLIYVFMGFDPSFIRSSYSIPVDNRIHQRYGDYKKNGEKLKNALGFDFGIMFKPLKNLSVSTGIVYEQRSESVNYQFKRNEVPVLDSATGEIFGYVILNDSVAEKINYSGNNSYTYVGVPLKINYNIARFSKWNIGISVGGSWLKQTSVSGKTIDPVTLKLVDLTGSNEMQSKNIVNGGFGLNVSYTFGKNVTAYFNPQFNSSFTKNNNVKNLMQTSFTVGLQYKLF